MCNNFYIAQNAILKDKNMYNEQQLNDIQQEYKYTGKQVRNLNSGKVGIILRINKSGSIQVLENIEPEVICTHDNWNTLELLREVE